MSQLENIKKIFTDQVYNMNGSIYMDREHVQWLIEQSEKAERYEKALNRIAYCEFDGWSGSDVLGKVTNFANKTLKD
ncbi:hypothetical protein DFO70_11129 [Cytobacillus firmus]|uniref:Uncharacterized protein n=2 Tax=Cytobacillus TaxID=2675230 RepID=A0A366JPS7_CYTFI|nr:MULTISPECIES: hypothetical protein [Cytobacillus]RBP89382.1 hypothetical protein DFO70_11129 [Cytobacillus firmus]TDX47391.1 hypothetical protein DFO72_101488 [Cytobacillus oceanisediminis]